MKRRGQPIVKEIKKSVQSSQLISFSLRSMATLRNRRKLAAVSREALENTRNTQSQNTLNPGLAEGDGITQIFEEIEGRVTENLAGKLS